jgi:hypothetical protein
MGHALPVHLAGRAMSTPRHACAFFRNSREEYQVLLPFILEGFERGEKAFHIVRPGRQEAHLRRLASAGLDVEQALTRGQLEVLPWTASYLRGGRFDPDAMLEMMEEVIQVSKGQGFRLTRIIGGAEWSLEEHPCVDELIEYEARLNRLLVRYEDPVTCVYDLSKFGASVAMDAMRTHRLVVIGGFLHENPFFVPPDRMLEELRAREHRRDDT